MLDDISYVKPATRFYEDVQLQSLVNNVLKKFLKHMIVSFFHLGFLKVQAIESFFFFFE